MRNPHRQSIHQLVIGLTEGNSCPMMMTVAPKQKHVQVNDNKLIVVVVAGNVSLNLARQSYENKKQLIARKSNSFTPSFCNFNLTILVQQAYQGIW